MKLLKIPSFLRYLTCRSLSCALETKANMRLLLTLQATINFTDGKKNTCLHFHAKTTIKSPNAIQNGVWTLPLIRTQITDATRKSRSLTTTTTITTLVLTLSDHSCSSSFRRSKSHWTDCIPVCSVFVSFHTTAVRTMDPLSSKGELGVFSLHSWRCYCVLCTQRRDEHCLTCLVTLTGYGSTNWLILSNRSYFTSEVFADCWEVIGEQCLRQWHDETWL